MNEELKCPVCVSVYQNPVLLPCQHAACIKCAVGLERPLSILLSEMTIGSDIDTQDNSDSDKGSVYSETDSGVVVTSRPSSYVSSPENKDDLHCGIKCPSCKKVIALGPSGVAGLPKFNALSRIISRYKGEPINSIPDPLTWAVAPPCHLCEGPPRSASVECKQCQILYCQNCLASFHPQRGPLASHNLEPAILLGTCNLSQTIELCIPHGERPTLHCQHCKWNGCQECAPGHTQHELQPLDYLTKNHKAELSISLQQLSDRAKSAHGHITSLKTFHDRVNAHCDSLAAEMERQCSALQLALENAKVRLRAQLANEKESTTKVYREQTANYTRKLQQTTSLVQFCIEAIKESDPVVFMQHGPQLTGRVHELEMGWEQELSMSNNKLSPYINLDLDSSQVIKAINSFNFIQMQPAFEGEARLPAAPGSPAFLSEECVGKNNYIIATWEPHPTSKIIGYALEIEDGDEFKEVFRGPDTVCKIQGLLFNTAYNLRVRAYNSTGISPYSSIISIRTSPSAWFTFERDTSHPEIVLLNEGTSITCESYEHRVSLANVGFSKGRHYWRFTIDAYNADADVVFGVAKPEVNREIMLGKDKFGWSMYIDHKRSWFLHNSAHHGRCDGGIRVGFTIGILLDLNVGSIKFFVNEEKQGETAFSDMKGLFYPAISINRNVSITLHTSSESQESSDYDSQSDS